MLFLTVLEGVDQNSDRDGCPAEHHNAAGHTHNHREYCIHTVTSRKEIVVVIVHVCEIILSTGLAAERSAIGNLLKVVQTAGDALVSVGVEGVEVDGSSAVDTGVKLAGIEDRLAGSIHDTGLRSAVGVDEVQPQFTPVRWVRLAVILTAREIPAEAWDLLASLLHTLFEFSSG